MLEIKDNFSEPYFETQRCSRSISAVVILAFAIAVTVAFIFSIPETAVVGIFGSLIGLTGTVMLLAGILVPIKYRAVVSASELTWSKRTGSRLDFEKQITLESISTIVALSVGDSPFVKITTDNNEVIEICELYVGNGKRIVAAVAQAKEDAAVKI